MRIGIIGMGHLGKAVLTGLQKSGVDPEQVTVSARTEKTLKMVRENYPGVAVSLCKGVIGVSCEEDKGQPGNALGLFEKLGYLVHLPEEDLEKVTICAASGLGFAAFIMKQYMDSCNRLFMDETVSEEITKRVFETALDIIREDGSSFEKLVGQICTKGGTTEAGINVLKQGNLGSIFDDCINEAISRVT